MLEKAYPRPLLWSAILQLVVLVAICHVCVGEEVEGWEREGAEIFFVAQNIGSDTVSYEDNAGRDEVDGTTVFGAGIGGTSNHWNLNMEFLYGSTSDTWTVLGSSVKHDATMWFLNLNLEYYVLKGRVTPLVTGGIGLFGMSGETFSGSDYKESNFSYNLGAGGRWDITDRIALRVIYRSTWARFDEADEANQFDGVLASVAYVFK